ncbi:hypothetical protein, partial [Duodenibacillus massiliensis]|uniref:hypothetical protein n=1 Tax=Duodenibacillus massiliensis TaxID=1852381 RepID=UPI003AB52E67
FVQAERCFSLRLFRIHMLFRGAVAGNAADKPAFAGNTPFGQKEKIPAADMMPCSMSGILFFSVLRPRRDFPIADPTSKHDNSCRIENTVIPKLRASCLRINYKFQGGRHAAPY